MKRSLLFVIFLLVVSGIVASVIFPDYMMVIMLPIILGIPIAFTIVNIVKKRPLLRTRGNGLPAINSEIGLAEENQVPSMNLSARSLGEQKE